MLLYTISFCEEITDPAEYFMVQANTNQVRGEGMHPYMENLLNQVQEAHDE